MGIDRMDTFSRLQAIQKLREESDEQGEDFTDVYDVARRIVLMLRPESMGLKKDSFGELIDSVAQLIIVLIQSRNK